MKQSKRYLQALCKIPLYYFWLYEYQDWFSFRIWLSFPKIGIKIQSKLFQLLIREKQCLNCEEDATLVETGGATWGSPRNILAFSFPPNILKRRYVYLGTDHEIPVIGWKSSPARGDGLVKIWNIVAKILLGSGHHSRFPGRTKIVIECNYRYWQKLLVAWPCNSRNSCFY